MRPTVLLRTCRALASLAGTAAVSVTLGACHADDATAPGALDPRYAFVVAPVTLAAVTDLQDRVTPSLMDASLRRAMGTALVELRGALDDGQAVRSRRALAQIRALLGTPDAGGARALGPGDVAASRTDTGSPDATGPEAERADDADLASIRLTVELISAELEVPAPPGEPIP